MKNGVKTDLNGLVADLSNAILFWSDIKIHICRFNPLCSRNKTSFEQLKNMILASIKGKLLILRYANIEYLLCSCRSGSTILFLYGFHFTDDVLLIIVCLVLLQNFIQNIQDKLSPAMRSLTGFDESGNPQPQQIPWHQVQDRK